MGIKVLPLVTFTLILYNCGSLEADGIKVWTTGIPLGSPTSEISVYRYLIGIISNVL